MELHTVIFPSHSMVSSTPKELNFHESYLHCIVGLVPLNFLEGLSQRWHRFLTLFSREKRQRRCCLRELRDLNLVLSKWELFVLVVRLFVKPKKHLHIVLVDFAMFKIQKIKSKNFFP